MSSQSKWSSTEYQTTHGGRPPQECSSGLGFCSAQSRALPALIASRVVSKSLVSIMVEWYCLATGAQHDVNVGAYHARTENARVSS